jgi:tetratricopeptide (TPR) repeat protein
MPSHGFKRQVTPTPLKRLAVILALLSITLTSNAIHAATLSQQQLTQQAIMSYKSGHYAKALPLFQSAMGVGPTDAQTVFYYGLTLAKTNQLDKARQTFDTLIQTLPPSDPIAGKARANITVLTRAQSMVAVGSSSKVAAIGRLQNQGPENYVGHAISGGRVTHWDPKKMPLNVYITDGSAAPGWSPGMNGMVQTAMNAWQEATYRKVRFLITRQKKDADIVIRWTRVLSHNKVGENPFESADNVIVRSDVTVALRHPESGQALSSQEVYTTILHELGHAIGIQGHSPFPEDIMYFSVNGKQGSQLSTRDKNTIRALYSLEADVKNSTLMTTAQSRQYYALLESGMKNQMGEDPKQAIDTYLKALALNPTDARLHYNLGLAYYATGQTDKAIQSYRQSSRLDSSRIEAAFNLGQLLVNRGVQAAQQSNVLNARQDFQEAVSLFQQVQNSPNAPAKTGQ